MIKIKKQVIRSSESTRPNINVYDDNLSDNFVLLNSIWGDPAALSVFNQAVSEYVLTASQDQESTSPFERLPHLSFFGNLLRTGILLGNEKVYRKFNVKEYSAGIESIALLRRGREICLFHCGSAMGFQLNSNKTQINPIGIQPSIQKNENSHPIPTQLIGIDSSTNIVIHEIPFTVGDSLFFVARDPFDIYDALSNPKKVSFDFLVDRISKKEDTPSSIIWIEIQ